MALKQLCQVGLLSISLLGTHSLQAQDNPLGQTFQINTHLQSYVGKPTWLIIISDVDTGQVLPYLLDFTSTDSFWLKFTFAHAYRVSVSELKFGPPNASIHNFCCLEDGILDRESLIITLSGDLTPNRKTSQCHVSHYKQYSFPIVEKEPEVEENPAAAATPAAGAAGAPSNPAAAIAKIAPSVAALAGATPAIAAMQAALGKK